ncbi:Agamous-like MADS-box protein AGL80 [Glycine max]|uniref:MADS-box domain-containing protein n=2 Tax=Glycine subgen. Soja TaxID=1462606 RepID=K7LQS0_SOYBN|nr:agamous-like MADS-box protein AGL80 [Glycine max]XP_028186387.1 agamous-like MADS-box protein AGL80 [Glycine soja]KAG4974605.1 hypothetical protein JHK87_031426 [Glycine soja]KAH1159663.1 hypothetical protein GYH30_031399 [Glycine max]KAH1225657.1 Agamous-like MADS-box protein AGL80 [Glycine max]KHN22555.1 Agamous-like MADS-box protein AGL80 [Glycine soja]RZB80699.1 Agamous-like MADS-box protein AGL80 [Glycine soja]|eukprot:XP_003539310.1 agamous-like MADS-box protein AGL80 [Glycine max]
MARKKVDFTYISNPRKRKAALKKRKNGLLKKIDEITTLCGIQACAIIYTPDEPEPEVWPSNQGVESVIFNFRGVSESARNKRMFCQESLLMKNITLAQGQLKKLRDENRKKEIGLFLCQYFAGGNNLGKCNIIDLNDITFLADKKLEEITKKIEMLLVQEVTPATENEDKP